MHDVIHCGDCMSILQKMPDRSVHLVVTDPPYGDNTGYGIHRRTIKGNANPLIGLMALHECYRLLKKNSNAYMFLDMKHLPLIRLFIEQYTPFGIRDFVVWDKMHIGMGYAFRKQYELVAVLEKGKPRYTSAALANVLNIKRINTADHPHKKPVELLEALIKHSSNPGDIVLDPFAGTGTTCVAAKKLGRRFIGIELEDAYCAIAEARIKEFKGQ